MNVKEQLSKAEQAFKRGRYKVAINRLSSALESLNENRFELDYVEELIKDLNHCSGQYHTLQKEQEADLASYDPLKISESKLSRNLLSIIQELHELLDNSTLEILEDNNEPENQQEYQHSRNKGSKKLLGIWEVIWDETWLVKPKYHFRFFENGGNQVAVGTFSGIFDAVFNTKDGRTIRSWKLLENELQINYLDSSFLKFIVTWIDDNNFSATVISANEKELIQTNSSWNKIQ